MQQPGYNLHQDSSLKDEYFQKQNSFHENNTQKRNLKNQNSSGYLKRNQSNSSRLSNEQDYGGKIRRIMAVKGQGSQGKLQEANRTLQT